MPGRQRAVLEIGQRRVATCGFDRGKARDQAGVACVLAIHPHALVVVQQVRRGVAADPITGREQDALEHRAARTLAVGTPHRDDHRVARHRHAVADGRHPLEPELDALAVTGLEQREPAGQAVGQRRTLP